MSVTNLSLNGNIYALMESTLKRPKAAERWFAICPLKGDKKWFAKTKEALTALLEKEEGVKASAFKPKKVRMWASESQYNGKPIVQWYTDGTMDVDTPTARFRMEIFPVNGRGRINKIIPAASDDSYDYFCDDLIEANNAYHLKGILTKIRLKNPDGTTLRDIDGLNVEDEGGNTTPMTLLDAYIEDIIEETSNDLVSLVHAFREDADADNALNGCVEFTTEVAQGAKAVFLVIDAMKFIDAAGADDAESSIGNYHHHHSNLSSQDALDVLNKLRPAVTALSSIL